MRSTTSAFLAATVLSSHSVAQLPGQAYIVTINGTITTIIEPLDAPAATFIGTDSRGLPTTAETTEPVTASTTPVAVSLSKLIGAPSTTGSISTISSTSTTKSTSLSALATGSSDSSSAASRVGSSTRASIAIGVALGMIMMACITS